MPHPGLLLVGHGTRNAIGTRCVERLGELVAERLPETAVRHAFLELNEQTVQRGIAQFVDAKVSAIVVAPLLLFAAGHAKSDIPREITSACPPEIDLCQADAFGCHPAIVELSQRRFEEAAGSLRPVSADRRCLVLVGRGSRDEQATAEMQRFARLRQEQTPQWTIEVAYIAMAEPTLTRVLGQLADAHFEQVIVQPHLLFPGELLDNLGAAVLRLQESNPETAWRLAPSLAADLGQGGPADRLLVDLVVERYEVAARSTVGD
jgi:sirohydrochlorin cobaltochelatase